MTDGDNSLGLSEVRQRFEESTTSLTKVETQLRELLTQQQQRGDAIGGLKVASDQLGEFAASLTRVTQSLQEASRSSEAAFSAVKSAADGTDLKAIRDQVEALARKFDEQEVSSAAAAKLSDELQARIALITGERDQMREELADQKRRFDKLKVAAGSRALKKAGLE